VPRGGESAGLARLAEWNAGPAARRDRGYPEPIVDHREAIAAYRAGRQRRSAARP
jgi:hypothetical protein